jgi:hypothetical protein
MWTADGRAARRLIARLEADWLPLPVQRVRDPHPCDALWLHDPERAAVVDDPDIVVIVSVEDPLKQGQGRSQCSFRSEFSIAARTAGCLLLRRLSIEIRNATVVPAVDSSTSKPGSVGIGSLLLGSGINLAA